MGIYLLRFESSFYLYLITNSHTSCSSTAASIFPAIHLQRYFAQLTIFQFAIMSQRVSIHHSSSTSPLSGLERTTPDKSRKLLCTRAVPLLADAARNVKQLNGKQCRSASDDSGCCMHIELMSIKWEWHRKTREYCRQFNKKDCSLGTVASWACSLELRSGKWASLR